MRIEDVNDVFAFVIDEAMATTVEADLFQLVAFQIQGRGDFVGAGIYDHHIAGRAAVDHEQSLRVGIVFERVRFDTHGLDGRESLQRLGVEYHHGAIQAGGDVSLTDRVDELDSMRPVDARNLPELLAVIDIENLDVSGMG